MERDSEFRIQDEHERGEGVGIATLVVLTIIGVLMAIAFGIGIYTGMAVGERDALLLYAKRAQQECRR
jgi:hypothetical protein